MFNITYLQHGGDPSFDGLGAADKSPVWKITIFQLIMDCWLSDYVFMNLPKFPELLFVFCNVLPLSQVKVTQRWTSLILIKIWVRISGLCK